jgi:hypothetical protein
MKYCYFQGHRSKVKVTGQFLRRGVMPRFALPLFIFKSFLKEDNLFIFKLFLK